MRANVHHISASSAPAAPLRLTTTTRILADREQTLTGVRGLAWVTLDNDRRDTVLGSGQRVTIPAHRLAVITPLKSDAEFEVSIAATPVKLRKVAVAAAQPRRSARPGSSWQRLLRSLAAAIGVPAHRGTPA